NDLRSLPLGGRRHNRLGLSQVEGRHAQQCDTSTAELAQHVWFYRGRSAYHAGRIFFDRASSVATQIGRVPVLTVGGDDAIVVASLERRYPMLSKTYRMFEDRLD